MLWHILARAIFKTLSSQYSMLVITHAFSGDHLGNLQLAAICIANNVIVGFDVRWSLGIPSLTSHTHTFTQGFLSFIYAYIPFVLACFSFVFQLGMSSALETLRGQDFGAKNYYMLGVYMQRSGDRSIHVLLSCFCLSYLFASPVLKLLGQPSDVRAIWARVFVEDTTSFQLCISVPFAEVLSEPAENRDHCVGFSGYPSGT